MQSFAFASQHDGGWFGVIDVVVQLGAAFVEPVDPETVLLQMFEGLAYICDSRNR
jgi:hypothetical protein